MAEKISIYAGGPIATALVGYETERSVRINRICADWQNLIAASVPTLTEAQWYALIIASSGMAMHRLWGDEAAATEICENLEEIEQMANVAGLRAMTLPQLIALRETMRRYWLAIEAEPTSLLEVRCWVKSRNERNLAIEAEPTSLLEALKKAGAHIEGGNAATS
jgi:hypothetical protein